MIRAHRAAIETLLAGLTFHVSRAPSGTAVPYVVLHPDQGAATTTSYGGDSDWRPWTFQTTCVGSTTEQAEWMAEKVEARLLDVAPAVTGRTCSPIRKTTTVPVDRDEDVQPPVFLARDVWAFASIPA